MKDKRGKRNILAGLLNQLITIVFSLVLPRMFIMSYGSEVNGLLSSVNQVYSYVALLEAGIGAASLQALYKTIAAGDNLLSNEVLAATNHYYHRTGYLYLSAVIVLSVAFPYILNTEVPKSTISIIVLLHGIGGVVNYFFQGKYRILLRAEGRNYLLTNLATTVYILTSVMKIVFIQLGFSIIAIQVAHLFISLLQMIYIMAYVKRKYTWIDLKVTPDYKAISSRRSVFVHQIANLVFGNTDILVLSVMVGLKEVSVYVLYSSFFNMVKSILYSFLDGVQYKLAQTFHSDFHSFLPMQEKFEAVYMTMTFGLYSILFVLISPFIKIYTRNITDIQYVDALLPVLFTIIFLLQGARGPMQLVTEYAQHFKQTRSHALIETIINLSITVLAVIRFGIYGALIGTIAALLYRCNVIIRYTNRKILKRSPLLTYRRWGWNAVIFLLIAILSFGLHINTNSYFTLALYAIPISLFISILYLTGLYIFENKAFHWLVALTKEKLIKIPLFGKTS